MDCRVKPGNDELDGFQPKTAGTRARLRRRLQKGQPFGYRIAQGMSPKSGNRFSDKIMPK